MCKDLDPAAAIRTLHGYLLSELHRIIHDYEFRGRVIPNTLGFDGLQRFLQAGRSLLHGIVFNLNVVPSIRSVVISVARKSVIMFNREERYIPCCLLLTLVMYSYPALLPYDGHPSVLREQIL
jgi:hypothetical protein